ncbi:MAG: aminotransferase class III-fold pyridoxal phosphate-dependent enzyme [Conexivisphaerales archaeon]
MSVQKEKNSTDDVVEITRRHTYGTWRKQKGWEPIHVVDAEGCYFYDSTNRRYLDFSSQLICSNLGHKNRNIIKAIVEQASQLTYVAPSFTCDIRAKATKALLEVLPKGLDKLFFSTSGTEANEAAIKIARFYTKKYKIISRYTSYHGSTAGSIAATGDFRRWYAEPAGKIDGVIFAPDAYCYRCPFNLEYPECGVACADYVEYMIEHENNVAAVLIEPVVGTNGVLVPPDDYLPRLREITDKHDVLLIADEVMSGWGRTGEWFAVNHWKVKPDIITTAKGVTSAYVPLGVTATGREIAEYFEENYFAHGHTYEAHPMTLAPVPAVIQEYRRQNILEKVKQKGEYMKKRLDEIKQKHRSVGDVRGLGLFWAVELVKSRTTKEPFNSMRDKYEGKQLMIDRITKAMMNDGVYAMGWVSHLVLAPPLIAEVEQLDTGLEALDKALAISDAEAL